MKRMFISMPEKAVQPVSTPKISPSPTGTLPQAISRANQVCTSAPMSAFGKSRYQSSPIFNAPCCGMATAPRQ
jgi:hypothetical protein